MEVTDQLVREVWKQMPLSPFQRVIHNELIQKIQEDRERLEKCSLQELITIQQRIVARRELLGLIHRKDKEQ